MDAADGLLRSMLEDQNRRWWEAADKRAAEEAKDAAHFGEATVADLVVEFGQMSAEYRDAAEEIDRLKDRKRGIFDYQKRLVEQRPEVAGALCNLAIGDAVCRAGETFSIGKVEAFRVDGSHDKIALTVMVRHDFGGLCEGYAPTSLITVAEAARRREEREEAEYQRLKAKFERTRSPSND